MATNTTAFLITKLVINNERFQLEITYYYNYNSVNNTWTNTETYIYNIHVTELNLHYNFNNINSAESCEVNGTNKCLIRYTNDMIDLSGNYNLPSILYNYILTLL